MFHQGLTPTQGRFHHAYGLPVTRSQGRVGFQCLGDRKQGLKEIVEVVGNPGDVLRPSGGGRERGRFVQGKPFRGDLRASVYGRVPTLFLGETIRSGSRENLIQAVLHRARAAANAAILFQCDEEMLDHADLSDLLFQGPSHSR